MPRLEKRLQALEAPPDKNGRPLSVVLPDDAPESELERLRRAGREVHRWSDAVELFI